MKNPSPLTCILALLFAVVCLCLPSTAFASPYLSMEPSSSGAGSLVGLSEDGKATADVTTGDLYWHDGYLLFGSETSYQSSFSLTYVGLGRGVVELGEAWRHTYSLSLAYVPGTSLTLTTAWATVIPFINSAVNTWVSQPGYGVYLSCTVAPTTLTLTDKYGNYIVFDRTSGLPTTIGDYYSPNTVTLAYTNGLLTTVTDATNRVFTLAYNGSGLLSSLADNTLAGPPTWLTLTWKGGWQSAFRPVRIHPARR